MHVEMSNTHLRALTALTTVRGLLSPVNSHATMINVEMLASLLVFAATATVTPGGATVIMVASGARFGFRRSIPLLFGIASGLASLTAIAGAGLGSVLQAWPELQIVMRAAGSAYLLWLAWRIGSAGAPTNRSDAAELPLRYVNGLLLLGLNPKAWTIAFGAAAAYAGLTPEPLRLAVILAAVFGSLGLLSLALWCAGGQALSRLLRTEFQWRLVNAALGLLLVVSVIPMWL
jgi:threonine/homoserine/homoserine lactone efflux protein